MKQWRKVGFFADGVIYACGNERKLTIPGQPDIYYEVKNNEVRWFRNARDVELAGLYKGK